MKLTTKSESYGEQLPSPAQAGDEKRVSLLANNCGGKVSADRIHNTRLALLFEIGTGHPVNWGNRELSDILQHQLRTLLLADLRPLASQIESLGLGGNVAAGHPLQTFGDLLIHPRPKLSLLRLAKDFAKTADSSLDAPLPQEVARALYISLIAAAIVRHGRKITEMDSADLKRGLEWVQSQEWIVGSMRRLATEALAELDLI